MIINNTFQLFKKVGVGAYFKRCVNRCKESPRYGSVAFSFPKISLFN
jgi:hypothetical protein